MSPVCPRNHLKTLCLITAVLLLLTGLIPFPAFVRAGSILPAAEGAVCAADVPLPPREILVYGGADGTFLLYDDAGDGYSPGITIPLRYEEAAGALVLEAAEGSLPEAADIRIRLTAPDGKRTEKTVRYDGSRVRISLRE